MSNKNKENNAKDSAQHSSRRNDNTENNQSDESKQQSEFPGYQPYPPSEDIMNRSTKVKRIDTDIENITRTGVGIGNPDPEFNSELPAHIVSQLKEPEDSVKIVSGNEADVTEEDIEALGPIDLSMDLGEDEQLKHRVHPVDFSGRDLDVPGSEDDDSREDIGAEDEENNPYSIGGDRHENLEEDSTRSL